MVLPSVLDATQDSVRGIEHGVVARPPDPSSGRGGISCSSRGGTASAQGARIQLPLMIALIAIVTFLLLARAFRSLLLPAKAVVPNALSVAAAWARSPSCGRRATARTPSLDPFHGCR